MTAVVTANRLSYTEAQWKRIANQDTNLLVDRLEEKLSERADDDNEWQGFAPLWHSLLLDMVKVVDRLQPASTRAAKGAIAVRRLLCELPEDRTGLQ